MDSHDKISLARAIMKGQSQSLAYLACGLVDCFEARNQTACTDGRTIFWNSDFLESITPEEAAGVLAHEVLHCCQLHHVRFAAALRDPVKSRLANLALDAVVNHQLSSRYKLRLPVGHWTDKRAAQGWSEEEIFAAYLAEQPPQQSRQELIPPPPEEDEDEGESTGGESDEDEGESTGGESDEDEGESTGGESPGEGDGESTGGESPGGTGAGPTAAELAQSWGERLADAATVEAMSASNADSIAGTIRAGMAEPQDWRQAIQTFAKSAAAPRSDWTRPARRTAGTGILAPHRRTQPALVVAVRDTSGSICPRQLAVINAALEEMQHATGCRLTVLDADDAVRAEYEIQPGDTIPESYQGGWGTEYQPALDRAAELAAAGVIYLGDMQTADASQLSSALPVIWCRTAGTCPPPPSVPGLLLHVPRPRA